MENKFRYVYQHEETGKIVTKTYTLEQIESKDLYLPRYNIIARNSFTGLHDKNNKEIYKGDILSNLYGDIGVVVWKERLASFDCSLDLVCFNTINWNKCEKIGNIYENSELLSSSNSD